MNTFTHLLGGRSCVPALASVGPMFDDERKVITHVAVVNCAVPTMLYFRPEHSCNPPHSRTLPMKIAACSRLWKAVPLHRAVTEFANLSFRWHSSTDSKL